VDRFATYLQADCRSANKPTAEVISLYFQQIKIPVAVQYHSTYKHLYNIMLFPFTAEKCYAQLLNETLL